MAAGWCTMLCLCAQKAFFFEDLTLSYLNPKDYERWKPVIQIPNLRVISILSLEEMGVGRSLVKTKKDNKLK